MVLVFALTYYFLMPVAEVVAVRRGTAISAVYGTVLIERAFPLWCLGDNILELLPRREVENENAWAPVYCKEASRTPH